MITVIAIDSGEIVIFNRENRLYFSNKRVFSLYMEQCT